jgi:hypothetical protein
MKMDALLPDSISIKHCICAYDTALHFLALVVLFHDGTLDNVLNRTCHVQSKYTVIRIDTKEEIDLKELKAILIYNRAICCVCQGQAQQGKQQLWLAMSLLGELYNASRCSFGVRRYVSLLTTAGEALVLALESFGQEQDAEELRTTLIASFESVTADLSSSGLFATMEIASPAA